MNYVWTTTVFLAHVDWLPPRLWAHSKERNTEVSYQNLNVSLEPMSRWPPAILFNHHHYSFLVFVLPLWTHSGCFYEQNLFCSICVEIWGTPGFSARSYCLCTLYWTFSNIVHHYSMSHHSFSNDNQLYKSARISQLQDKFNPRSVIYLTLRTGWQTISYSWTKTRQTWSLFHRGKC